MEIVFILPLSNLQLTSFSYVCWKPTCRFITQTLFKSLLRMKRKQHCNNNNLDNLKDTLNCLGSYGIANGMEW